MTQRIGQGGDHKLRFYEGDPFLALAASSADQRAGYYPAPNAVAASLRGQSRFPSARRQPLVPITMLGGGDFTPPKTSSKDKSGDPPEPLLAEPAEPLGFLRLDCTLFALPSWLSELR